MISFPCAGCGRALKGDESAVGKKVKCTGCGTVQRVPNLPSDRAATPSTSRPREDARRRPPTEAHESNVLVARPSLWRNHLVGVVVCAALIVLCVALAIQAPHAEGSWIALGLAAIPGLVVLKWFLWAMGSSLTVTTQRSILREGILSRATIEVRHRDIRTIGVRQGVVQRLLGVGQIDIASSGHGGIEISLAGLVDPNGIANAIRALQA